MVVPADHRHSDGALTFASADLPGFSMAQAHRNLYGTTTRAEQSSVKPCQVFSHQRSHQGTSHQDTPFAVHAFPP